MLKAPRQQVSNSILFRNKEYFCQETFSLCISDITRFIQTRKRHFQLICLFPHKLTIISAII